PRKRPIMTSDHADKMEITVVFQCPLKKGLNYNKQVGICLPIVISQKRCLLKLGITNFYKDILIPNSGYKNLLCLKFDKAGSYTLIKEV
ncbi:hypothetical protein, partial [Prevotella dentalis]|uniref:hypothetical protein n=1 Tax=Prevotella dentalis TaxID=52227 RepID=UPI0026596239